MKRKTNNEEIRLHMNGHIRSQILALLMTNNEEIGWYGVIEELDETNYKISKILVFPQYVTSASFDTTDEEYMKWRDNLPYEDFKNIRMLGHSHVNMGAFSSSIDNKKQLETIEAFKGHDTMYFFPIFNKRLDYWCMAVNPKTETWYNVELPQWDSLKEWTEEANEKVDSLREYYYENDDEDFDMYDTLDERQFVFGGLEE